MRLIELYEPPENPTVGPYAWYANDDRHFAVFCKHDPYYGPRHLWLYISSASPIILDRDMIAMEYSDEEVSDVERHIDDIDVKMLRIENCERRVDMECTWEEFRTDPISHLTKALL